MSVPFCRSKCSFCNFASGVFPQERLAGYCHLLASDLRSSASIAARLGASLDRRTPVDTIYLGGGTPSLLPPALIHPLFAEIRAAFAVTPDAEITVECAPNSLSDESLDALLEAGVNRISFGVQSFIDRETSSVARLHGSADTLRDIARVRRAGIPNISLDLIAGLPHQTLDSWDASLSQLIDLAVPHASIYMLEVDEDSRLGREVIAGGVRYHAHTTPDETAVIRMYERAIERLHLAGLPQYEISNFARPGCESRHNLKYWERTPYFGFGADAHSKLPASAEGLRDLRFATTEELADFERASDRYSGEVLALTPSDALEEAMIVGLRLNRGVHLPTLARTYGIDPRLVFAEPIAELTSAALLRLHHDRLSLTDRGRLLSNEIFERFLHAGTPD